MPYAAGQNQAIIMKGLMGSYMLTLVIRDCQRIRASSARLDMYQAFLRNLTHRGLAADDRADIAWQSMVYHAWSPFSYPE
jgi:hypothetical protein